MRTLLLLASLLLSSFQPLEDFSFSQFIANYVPLRLTDGKIDLPSTAKHVKLDIGLSYNAPMSQHWLTQEEDLVVFGFEPNPESLDEITRGAIKKASSHGDSLDVKYIGSRFFLIPCALGASSSEKTPFYITAKDCGCSSLYQPKSMDVSRVIEVPVFTLSDFFDLFPFDTHPVIDYIKIDAQGADLNIAKGAGRYLSDRVVFITLEAENAEYKNTSNSENEIGKYMKSIGFIRYRSSKTTDPTYLNTRFAAYAKTHQLQIYQKG